jgi:hypothetical protein
MPFFFKGVIWLLLAILAGVVPTVSVISFLYVSLPFSFDVQVFACLNLNGIFCSLVQKREILIELESTPNIRGTQHGTFLFATRAGGLPAFCDLAQHRCFSFPG